MEHRLLPLGIKLPPQVVDVDVHDVRRLGRGWSSPNLVGDLGPREHLAGVPHEELEERELALGERQFSAPALDVVLLRPPAPPMRIIVKDSTGKVLLSASETGDGSLSGDAGTVQAPVKLVLRVPTKLKEVRVPFEMKDFVLP